VFDDNALLADTTIVVLVLGGKVTAFGLADRASMMYMEQYKSRKPRSSIRWLFA
jgi:hypothetical protein